MAPVEWHLTERHVWLITGAAGGLGRELATTALDAGHNVLATDLNGEALPAPDEGVRPRLRAMALDVTDTGAARDAVQYALSSFGRLDVVVNNAGYGSVGSIEDMPEERVPRATIETNLFGVVNMVRAALPVMRRAAFRALRDRSRRSVGGGAHARAQRIPDREVGGRRLLRGPRPRGRPHRAST